MLKNYSNLIVAQVKEEARFWMRAGGSSIVAMDEPWFYEVGYKDQEKPDTVYMKASVYLKYIEKDSNIISKCKLTIRVDKIGANVVNEVEL